MCIDLKKICVNWLNQAAQWRSSRPKPKPQPKLTEEAMLLRKESLARLTTLRSHSMVITHSFRNKTATPAVLEAELGAMFGHITWLMNNVQMKDKP